MNSLLTAGFLKPNSASCYPSQYGLRVADLELVSNFYQNVVGLKLISASLNTHKLGLNDIVILELHHLPQAKIAKRSTAGLFHCAFLLPSVNDLASFVDHLQIIDQIIDGAADHSVSEAIYLSDPEGNGVEVYYDRQFSAWEHHNSQVKLTTDALDFKSLMQKQNAKWAGIPDGSILGHLHLKQSDLELSTKFYSSILGFELTASLPGAVFLSTDGYHHHLGINVWHSKNAANIDETQTGLSGYKLKCSEFKLQQIIDALVSSKWEHKVAKDTVTLIDPCAIKLEISAQS